ncbi:hypothetical protein [Telluribacter humicola]|uniref:hypothetical protein n=1 Tax=Telluribacter humicola TaxID=1720261 RepID=UPI001A966D66|nr:hypothetical protein [Telluribacter humicola]
MKSRMGISKVYGLGLLLFIVGLIVPVNDAGAVSDNLVGVWYFPYKKAYIEISKSPSSHYTGRIIGVTDKSYIPYLNQVVMDGVQYQKGNWEGTFVHPIQRTRFDLSMNISKSGQIEALIYKGHRLIGRTFDMQRRELPGDVYVINR